MVNYLSFIWFNVMKNHYLAWWVVDYRVETSRILKNTVITNENNLYIFFVTYTRSTRTNHYYTYTCDLKLVVSTLLFFHGLNTITLLITNIKNELFLFVRWTDDVIFYNNILTFNRDRFAYNTCVTCYH